MLVYEIRTPIYAVARASGNSWDETTEVAPYIIFIIFLTISEKLETKKRENAKILNYSS